MSEGMTWKDAAFGNHGNTRAVTDTNLNEALETVRVALAQAEAALRQIANEEDVIVRPDSRSAANLYRRIARNYFEEEGIGKPASSGPPYNDQGIPL